MVHLIMIMNDGSEVKEQILTQIPQKITLPEGCVMCTLQYVNETDRSECIITLPIITPSKNKNIEDLLDKWEEGNMSVQDLSNELYALFSVSEKRKLLESFVEWRENQGYCTCIGDQDIDGFLNELK